MGQRHVRLRETEGGRGRVTSCAKAAKGNWLVLAEWSMRKDYSWKIKSVKTVKVDGKIIKADTYYTLKRGKFVKVKS